MCWFVLAGTVFLVLFGVDASHFRGGTISWKPTGNGNEVQFSFKLGWAYNAGPGCTVEKIGQLVTNMNTTYWQCTSGCTSIVNIANVNYICTGASQLENWEQGERTFTYTFPGIGPYTVEFTGGAWVTLSYGSPGSWSIGTVVYLAQRNDTQRPNISPVTTGKPLYRLQYGCQNEIVIPVADGDNDDVKCRWSTGSECVSICNALPSATIDSNTCTIRFPATHTPEGIFAVAVTVQDFPKSNISIGGQVYLSSQPISTVTLQFLVQTPTLTTNCGDKPVFVSPTLPQGSTIYTDVSMAVNISFYAFGNTSITSIDLTTPAGMMYSSLQNDPLRSGTVFVKATWTPQQNQVGSHIVCALAEDNLGKTSDSRCMTINVNNADKCSSNPCRNHGTCTTVADQFQCSCAPGFTDNMCQTNIDECESQPCQHQGSCIDGMNHFTCLCPLGFTGLLCETDINECTSQLCQNQGACIDGINQFTCSCPPGFTGMMCETDIDECANNPCQNNGTCVDGVNQFQCSCVSGFTDNICQTNINECTSQPCQNHGACIDGINQFTCSCPPGFTGMMCEIDIDECANNPCQNNGTCIDGVNQFQCSCVSGFTDNICQTNINECNSQPCQNQGSCIDGINQFMCLCHPGFTGAICETDIDECLSSPCQNNGTCLDKLNHFQCSCVAGFTDDMCQKNIDECASHPCQNQGSCIDGINQFTCLCSRGFTGKMCETDINECIPDPCNFLFECEDRINNYHCTLIEWRLALIILISFVLIIIFYFVIILLKRNRFRDRDHNCLKTFINSHRAVVQPEPRYQ